MSVKHFMSVFALFFGFLIGQNLHAQQSNLWGSGVYQGQMVCPYEPKTSRAAVSMSDEEKEERKKITSLKAELKLNSLEKKRAEAEVDYLRKKLDRFFDSSVVEFVLDTHVEGAKKCDEYRTFHPRCNPQPVVQAVAAAAGPSDQAVAVASTTTVTPPLSAADQTFCDGLTEPPDILAKKWNSKDASGKGNYCVGTSKSNAGSVSPSICSDASLRPSDTPKYRTFNTSECTSALTNYRKKKIALSIAADKEERITEEISDRTYAIADARERAKIEREYRQSQTESDCEDCDNAARGYAPQKLKRDWVSTAVNVVGGALMMGYGKKAEEAANEYNAQAGWPSTQSYGYPFYQAGISGVINGLTGPGAYGCASTVGGGGFPFGAGGGWNLGGSANGAFGPFAGQGGAFGYPQNMFGSPWGGGAFTPGFGPNGQVNGPFGGVNIGGQFGFPNNGNMAMCVTFPCNIGGQGGGPFGGNPLFGGQLGGQIGGQFGNPFGNPLLGGNGQLGFNGGLSAQYQLQMLQQQQQMQIQQMQQQQQYYQMQMQQQQQAMQVYYQRQQQTIQITQQIQQLNMQLQMLQQQSYYGLGGSLGGGGGVNFGGGFNFGVGIGIGTGGAPGAGGFVGGGNAFPGGTPSFYPPTTGGGTTFPGTGTGRGR
jgi:hypothetical protein